MNIVERTDVLTSQAAVELRDTPLGPSVAQVVSRLHGPLRVAIAGRVKAGKSTLLNALVRDRLAATDAGECTKVITEYRQAISYDVRGQLPDGSWVDVPAQREEDGLRILLPEHLSGVVHRMEVRWPSSTLQDVTYIDTPGLASVNAANSALTESALTPEDGDVTDADAVLYLMRHVHQRDVAFLESFMDRTITLGTPLNSLGLLSRADEIGAGRLDAMTSAARIAGRYRLQPQMRQLVGDVLPTAALLAETAATATEDEVALLRQLAREVAGDRERELATVDRIRGSATSSLSDGEREHLLARFGLFGLRVGVEQFAVDAATPTSKLVDHLYVLSGIGEVRRRIETQFVPQAAVLKARTALTSLRRIGHELSSSHHAVGARLLAEVERVEASALEFTRLRTLHLVSSGLAGVSPAEAEQVRQLVMQPGEVGRSVALAAIDRWRTKMESPLLSAPAVELGQLLVRLYEDRTIVQD